jgi:hypothetical protein
MRPAAWSVMYTKAPTAAPEKNAINHGNPRQTTTTAMVATPAAIAAASPQRARRRLEGAVPDVLSFSSGAPPAPCRRRS